MVLTDEFDPAWRGACAGGGWSFTDSGVVMILTNVLICAPIWQFIECFYSIPLEFGYFDPDNSDEFVADLDDEAHHHDHAHTDD